MANETQVSMVNLTIDGKPVSVPKGTNIIQAAKTIGVEIPHFCYHPCLSIAGNCRICQVKIKGAPKLDIACNLQAKEGMEVSTHCSSEEVAQAQAATLEFILANHPLDCTVCDRAGHCKLQDYHYQYNAKNSRCTEEKEHKVKAKPLGPTVMLDGERCIMCTRCIRFCDEVTKTSELGMLNRGDKSVISVHPGKELSNPLSGTVVDLCPVGALTHSKWRFNTRIWFTKESDGLCPGCSTGCNVKVAVRDRKVMLVKGRYNEAVNKEWMCDEGRYGFDRFLPENRFDAPIVSGAKATWDSAVREALPLSRLDSVIVFVSPDLVLEEYVLLQSLLLGGLKQAVCVLSYQERELTEVERLLVSPDYAANFRGAQFAGLARSDLEAVYLTALDKVREGGEFTGILLVGDKAIAPGHDDEALCQGLNRAALSIAIGTNADSAAAKSCRVVLPGRSILEKSGLMINQSWRLQYTEPVVEAPQGTEPDWRIINRLGEVWGGALTDVDSDRELTRSYLASDPRLSGLSIAEIKAGGVCLKTKGVVR